MAVKTLTAYIAVCDRCKKSLEDRGDYEYPWASARENTVPLAVSVGWAMKDGKLLCRECSKG